MDSFLSLWLTYTLSFFLLVLLPIIIINLFTQGFLFKWIAVKISRGKKFLIILDGIRKDRYFTGVEENEMIVFKDYKKEIRRLALSKKAIRRGWGIDYILINDDKNAVIDLDFSVVSGFDAEKNNSLYVRALYKPQILDNKQMVVLVLLVLTFLACVFIIYNLNTVLSKIDLLQASLNILKTTTSEVGSKALTNGGV